MADWSLVPIHRVSRKDKHMGFDVFNGDALLEGEVLDTKKTMVDEICEAKFDRATLEVRHNHLFYLGNATFTPVIALGDRLAVGINSARKAAKSRLLSIERLSEILFVYNLWTSTNNYIVTDENGEFFYFVHNNKIGPGGGGGGGVGPLI